MDFVDPTLAKIKQEFEDINEDAPDFVSIRDVRDLQLNKFEFVSAGNSFPNSEVKHKMAVRITKVNGEEDDLEEIKKEHDTSNSKDQNKPKKKSVQCELCDVTCRNSDKYRLHMMDHTGERPFKCDKCDKAYKTAEAVASHMKIHTDDSPTVLERTTFGKRGQIIHGQGREVIANVINFMKSEAELYQTKRLWKIPLTDYKQRVIAATGMSEDNSYTMAEHLKFGQVIQQQAREIISNITAFIKSEAELYEKTKEPKLPLTSYKQRVIAATGISEGTYSKINREAANVRNGLTASFSTPRQKRKKGGSDSEDEEDEEYKP